MYINDILSKDFTDLKVKSWQQDRSTKSIVVISLNLDVHCFS